MANAARPLAAAVPACRSLRRLMMRMEARAQLERLSSTIADSAAGIHAVAAIIHLFAADAGGLDDGTPFLVVGADEGGEVLARAADRSGAEREQTRLHGRGLHRLHAVLGKLRLDGGRKTAGAEQTPPDAGIKSGKSRLRDRGRIRQDRRADRGGDAERPHRAG